MEEFRRWERNKEAYWWWTSGKQSDFYKNNKEFKKIVDKVLSMGYGIIQEKNPIIRMEKQI